MPVLGVNAEGGLDQRIDERPTAHVPGLVLDPDDLAGRAVRGMDAAIAEVREKGAQVAFLLDSTPIDDMARIIIRENTVEASSPITFAVVGLIVGFLIGLACYRLFSKSERDTAALKQTLLEREHKIAELKKAMGSSLTGIHHPSGSYKRISFADRVGDAPATVDGTILHTAAFVWASTAGNTKALAVPSSGAPIAVGTSTNIILTVATNSMTAGGMIIYCMYIPLSSGASVA